MNVLFPSFKQAYISLHRVPELSGKKRERQTGKRGGRERTIK